MVEVTASRSSEFRIPLSFEHSPNSVISNEVEKSNILEDSKGN